VAASPALGVGRTVAGALGTTATTGLGVAAGAGEAEVRDALGAGEAVGAAVAGGVGAGLGGREGVADGAADAVADGSADGVGAGVGGNVTTGLGPVGCGTGVTAGIDVAPSSGGVARFWNAETSAPIPRPATMTPTISAAIGKGPPPVPPALERGGGCGRRRR
jgi:hypothetical protein